MSVSDWISISIAFISLVITIIIFIIQFRIDKRVNKQLEERRRQDIETKVKKFIIEHDDQIQFIPLCFISSKFDCHHRYIRKIYNDFNYLSIEEQNELLKQLKYDYFNVSDNNWLDNGLFKVKKFIEDNKFGKSFLHDDYKYFKRSLLYAKEEYDCNRILKDPVSENIFYRTRVNIIGNHIYEETLSIKKYIWEYYERIILKKDKIALLNPNIIPPMDLLQKTKNLGYCDEKECCFWIMNVVEAIVDIFNENIKNYEKNYIKTCDVYQETFEDNYLIVLMKIYNFAIKNEIELKEN